MASTDREVLGEHYGEDHLTYEQIEELDLRDVTEDGETLGPEELRGKIFRIVDPDELSGYVVKNMETTGQSTTLCYLQASSWSSLQRGRAFTRTPLAKRPKADRGGARFAEALGFRKRFPQTA